MKPPDLKCGIISGKVNKADRRKQKVKISFVYRYIYIYIHTMYIDNVN